MTYSNRREDGDPWFLPGRPRQTSRQDAVPERNPDHRGRAAGLEQGAVFLVPALSTQAPWWWRAARIHPLEEQGRVRVVLAQSDHRGRPYRMEMDREEPVVWPRSVASAASQVSSLGQRVSCPLCGRWWGYLPVAVLDIPCSRCIRPRREGI